MASSDIVDAYISTKQALYDGGIRDDFVQNLIASRLLIERVGESDNQDWWDSRVLSETGRARLSEVTPNTRLKSRIDLSMKIGRKAESDRLPGDSVSLFSFGPQVESQLTAAIKEIGGDDEVVLEALEGLSIQSLDEGWTDVVITKTESGNSTESDAASIQERASEESFLLNEREYTQNEIDHEKWKLLTTLLRGYGHCTDRLHVPYYQLGSELKPDNA